MNRCHHRNRFSRWGPASAWLAWLLLALLGNQALFAASWLPDPARTVDDSNLESLMQNADEAQGIKRDQILLQAARILIHQHEIGKAQRLLQSIDFKKGDEDANDYHTTWALWYLARQQPWKAITQLKAIQFPPGIPDQEKVNTMDLLAKAYSANHQQLSVMELRIQISDDWQDADQKQLNDQAIWIAALQLSKQQRERALNDHPKEPLFGWLTLAGIAHQAEANDPNWLSALQKFEKEHPQHPALNFIDTDVIKRKAIQQIALLVPIEGPLGARGQAIYHGMLTAYYAAKAPKPTLNLYDTHDRDIRKVYHQAVKDGADMVIGPLDKKRVQTLSDERLRVPTIFLNTVNDTIDGKAPILQFALSPIDEAKQISHHLWQKGYRQIMVVAVKGQWGEQLVSSFKNAWEKEGGQLADTLLLDDDTPWAKQIRAAMGVDASQGRIRSVRQALRSNIRSTPTRRADIDAICLLTTPYQSRHIVPLLRFYYAGHLPLYALSQTDPGYALNPNYYRDLENVHLPTTAWMASPEALPKPYQSLYATAQQHWPEAFKRHRPFFGLGMDAYTISQQWLAFLALPHFPIEGASGRLMTLGSQQVHRHLAWGMIQNNQVVYHPPR